MAAAATMILAQRSVDEQCAGPCATQSNIYIEMWSLVHVNEDEVLIFLVERLVMVMELLPTEKDEEQSPARQNMVSEESIKTGKGKSRELGFRQPIEGTVFIPDSRDVTGSLDYLGHSSFTSVAANQTAGRVSLRKP